MRAVIWLYFAALTIASTSTAVVAGMFSNILKHSFGNKPMPPLTQFVLDCWPWIFALPVPWLLASMWLSRGESGSTQRCYMFAASVTFAIVLLFSTAAVAFTCPYVSIMQQFPYSNGANSSN
jgi:hypothetical protein